MCLSEEAVKENLHRVKSIAGQWSKRLPSTVMYDDLVQIGWEAVLELAMKFDPATIAFQKQVSIAIKRQIIDHLRDLDHMPRYHRKDLKTIQAAEDYLSKRFNRKPSCRDIAKQAGFDLDTYFWIVGNESVGAQTSTDFYDDDHAHHWNTPEGRSAPELTNEELYKVVGRLHDRNRTCIHLKYFGELNNRQVATEMGVTESRISQIHQTALDGIRDILNKDQKRCVQA